ncbi:hypothetical protein McanMca71_008026 [Microsporum canis]|uniref:Uncharacterized protein n=1 Tax=Arthroderma otae (strain ATCC MYA-4605 / CBS 113480) TaxID=554155 RepID=C5FE07_ARTOC|nr:uncharacterized protein MCYG_00929 [Microsporum canis CBS 113480]EEQ28041.1 predicted protein [Microsporum canis CBS 113480]
MSKIIRRFISYIGKTKLEDFVDPKVQSQVQNFCEDREKKDSRCIKAEIKGTRFHRSHDDPTDEKEVLTIKFFNEDDKRVGTGHLHEDGTYKFRYKRPPPEDAANGYENQ